MTRDALQCVPKWNQVILRQPELKRYNVMDTKEFKEIKNFTTDKLLSYLKTTNKRKNIERVNEVITNINSIECANDEDALDSIEKLVTYISVMQKAWLTNGQNSIRLAVLLAFLKTQITQLGHLKEMGCSAIYPEEIEVSRGSKWKNIGKIVLNKPNSYNNFALTYKYGLPDDVLDKIDYLSILYVTPGPHNPYGHSILQLGDQGYLHINTLNGRPQYLSPEMLPTHLKINKAEIAAIQNLPIRNLENAKVAIKKLSSKRWFWRGTHHNCLSFAQAIAIAGGVSFTELGCDHSTAKLPAHFYASKLDSVAKTNPTYLDNRFSGVYNRIVDDDSINLYIEHAKQSYKLTDQQARLYSLYRVQDELADNLSLLAINYGEGLNINPLLKLIGGLKCVNDNLKVIPSIVKKHDTRLFTKKLTQDEHKNRRLSFKK